MWYYRNIYIYIYIYINFFFSSLLQWIQISQNRKKNLSVKIFYTYDIFCFKWFLFRKKEYVKTCCNKKCCFWYTLHVKIKRIFSFKIIPNESYIKTRIGHHFLFLFSLLNILIQAKSLFFFHDMIYNLAFSKIMFSYNNKYQHPRPSWRTLDTHHLTDTTDAFL